MAESNGKNIADSIEDVADAIDELAADDSVQALQQPLLARVPQKVRGAIYEGGKWLGLVGAAGLAVAGVIGGEPQRYIEAAGLLVLAVSNWIAKANLAA